MMQRGMRRGWGLALGLCGLLVLVGSCGDDNGEDTGGDSSSSETGNGTDLTGGMTTDISTTSMPTTTTTATTSASAETTGEADGTGTGMSSGTVVLQNDSWTSADGLSWQTWPMQNDCWASSFDIDAQHYPFDIVAVQAVIGGADATESFEIGVWEVDDSHIPTQEIDSTLVDIQGNAPQIPEIDLVAEGLQLSTITEGSFAIVMCHVDHMGSPSIAVDADNNVDGGNNWVFQKVMGDWASAPDFFGISGDFIMRAVIEPQ